MNNQLRVVNSVFDVSLFSHAPYQIDPAAVSYLLKHGFNFNSQYRYGIRYMPAFAITTDSQLLKEDEGHSIKKLFLNILATHKPVVLHNGLIDLVFLYHHFYAPLPLKQAVFVADLCDMFVGGVYDTKQIPLSEVLKQPSYLEYLLYRRLVAGNRLGN